MITCFQIMEILEILFQLQLTLLGEKESGILWFQLLYTCNCFVVFKVIIL